MTFEQQSCYSAPWDWPANNLKVTWGSRGGQEAPETSSLTRRQGPQPELDGQNPNPRTWWCRSAPGHPGGLECSLPSALEHRFHVTKCDNVAVLLWWVALANVPGACGPTTKGTEDGSRLASRLVGRNKKHDPSLCSRAVQDAFKHIFFFSPSQSENTRVQKGHTFVGQGRVKSGRVAISTVAFARIIPLLFLYYCLYCYKYFYIYL